MNLAKHIAGHSLFYNEDGPHMHVCGCGWHVPDELESEYLDGDVEKSTAAHAAHVAAAWAEHRTITTVDEFFALPPRAVIRDRHGRALVASTRAHVGFPARIIFHPEEDQ